MIKNFKRGSYRISKIAALGCLVCTVATITNGIQVNALDVSKLSNMENTIIYSSDSSGEKMQFLIDADEKEYGDPYKAQKVAGFKYKLPDYVVDNYDVGSGNVVRKVSDDENAVFIEFYNKDENAKGAWSYSMLIFKGDPKNVLKSIQEKHNGRQFESFDVEQQDKSINGVDGQVITVTISYPEQKDGDLIIPVLKEVSKYFVWKENGINYGIRYKSVSTVNKEDHVIVDISEDNASNIVKSLKDIDKITNVNYYRDKELFTKDLMNIYDEEDLKKAKNIIGFNPKFPVNIDNGIKLGGAHINIADDSDVENNNMDYYMDMEYEIDGGFITLTSEKSNKTYDEIKEKGYYDSKKYDIEKDQFVPVKINAEKLNLGHKEVYKSREENEENDTSFYFWEEDGICYELMFWNSSEDSVDSIAELFINSQEYK